MRPLWREALIGAGAMVCAGAAVIRDVPPNAIVVGNPARITGRRSTTAAIPTVARRPSQPGVYPGTIPGVNPHRLPRSGDMRGTAPVGEFERVPFPSRDISLL
jgi:hypothetical protein